MLQEEAVYVYEYQTEERTEIEHYQNMPMPHLLKRYLHDSTTNVDAPPEEVIRKLREMTFVVESWRY